MAARGAVMPGAGPPIRDFEGLRIALADRAPNLSPRLGQVARFCLNHPEEVAIDTLVALAAQAGVPPATITRFAKEMGFAGFAELQAVFRERLLGPRLPYSARIAGLAGAAGPHNADLDLPGAVFDGFVHAAVNALLRIGEEIDRNMLDRVVETLAGAAAVHVAAARGAFGVGAYSVYGLATTGKRAHLIDNLGAMRAQQVAAIAPDDVLMVLTFDDYTPETVEVARMAHAAGRPVIAITDNDLSPVVPVARHVLYVPEARLGHFRSQVPAMVVCQAIIVAMGRRMAMEQDSQFRENENPVAPNRRLPKSAARGEP